MYTARFVRSIAGSYAQCKTNARCFSAASSIGTTHQPGASPYGLYGLLTDDERDLLSEQRRLTESCRYLATDVFRGLDDSSSVLAKLSPSILQQMDLEGSFSVVIAGEFNAGKSTLINALLGTKLLESGALPTTDAITIVTASTGAQSENLPLGVLMHPVPGFPLLQDLTLIDTPGTNSTWLDHTEQTLRLLPSADLILFVTSAERPFSESERTLLQSIQAFRKSIVVVVNKMDVLEADGGDHGQKSKNSVVDFVVDRSSELLGARPIVIPVSSRDGLSAKLMEKSALPPLDEHQRSSVWHRSNFGALEDFLKDSLTTQAKIKSKLTSPVGVAEAVMVQCLDELKEQRDELKADVATLNVLQTQFSGWRKELQGDLQHSRQQMTEMVRKEGDRCSILLHRMNVWNFHKWVLHDTERLETEWQETRRQMLALRQKDLQDDLLDLVQDTAESVATRGRAQGQAVIEYLGKRPAMKNQSLVGSVTAASRFEDTRKNLQERLSLAVEDTFHLSEAVEKERIFSSLRTTAMVSSSFQVGALCSLLAMAVSLLEPVSAMVASSSLATSGYMAYKSGTSRIDRQSETQWSERASFLDATLEAICSKEVDRVNRRIMDGVAPYTQFVQSEQERIERLQNQCETLRTAARTLRNRISKTV